MLFNHWYLVNREFCSAFDVNDLRKAWEVFEEDGVDSFTIGKGFTGMLRAFTGAGIEIVDGDEFEAKVEAGIIKKGK